MHPTYDEILDTIDELIESESCLICAHFHCPECLIDKIEHGEDRFRCTNITVKEKLLGFAFLLTMPSDIRKSLEEL